MKDINNATISQAEQVMFEVFKQVHNMDDNCKFKSLKDKEISKYGLKYSFQEINVYDETNNKHLTFMIINENNVYQAFEIAVQEQLSMMDNTYLKAIIKHDLKNSEFFEGRESELIPRYELIYVINKDNNFVEHLLEENSYCTHLSIDGDEDTFKWDNLKYHIYLTSDGN